MKKNLFAASLLAMLCLGNASAMNDGDTAETPPQPPAKQTNASAMNDGDAAETTPPPPPAKQTTADSKPAKKVIQHVHVNVLIVGEKGVGKTALAARIYNGLLTDRGYECASKTEEDHSDLSDRIPMEQKELDELVSKMNKELKKSGEAVVTYNPPRDVTLEREKNMRWHFYIKEANVNDRNINELYKKASLIFPVFDMNDKKFTAKKAVKWYDDIRKAAGEEDTDYVSSYVHFLGNKFDIFAKNFQGELYDQRGGANYPQNEIFQAAMGLGQLMVGRRRCVEGSGCPISCLTGDFGSLDGVLSAWGEDHKKLPEQAGWMEGGGAVNFQISDQIGPAAAIPQRKCNIF